MLEDLIVGCIGAYGERVDQALEGIRRLRPGVDRLVVIVDESVKDEQKKVLRDVGCEVYFHPWQDSMVKMRNQYLQKAQTDDWVVVFDPDECFNEQFVKDVKELTRKAEAQGVDLLLINSHDVTTKQDGSKDESVSDFFKNLIFRKREGTKYEGVGEIKEVHETLDIPGIKKAVRLPKEKYWYTHTKFWWEVWERAARNVFLAGGGNNVGTRNEAWPELKNICDNLELDNWPKAREYFRKGNIDPRLKKWLWDNRYEGFDYHHEMMEFGRWYFEYLHPDEAEGWIPVTELREGSPPEVMRYVEETYLKVLGRHAEDEGKIAYTNAILSRAIRREELPAILRQSAEYRQKVAPIEGGESIRMQVPVNVDIKITDELFVLALQRSNVFWEKIKPKLDIGTFLEEALGEDWEKFQKWFYSQKEMKIEDFIKKLKVK